jgi:preprotein translocase subunit SecD
MALAGLLKRPQRLALWLGAACFAGAAWFARSDGFAAMVSLGMFGIFALVLALPIMDLSWRARSGLVVSVVLLAGLVLWPSVSSMSGGRVPCPEWVKERVGARLVAGLDLRGGLRLVYTVDVQEAIKDKRDRYYEDMRRELAKLYADHSGDEAPSEETLERLRQKVDLAAPRRPAHIIRLEVKDGSDPGKIDARFRDLFKPDVETRVVGPRSFEFAIRQAAESQIRERAVSQAREIILRRVDELGLREAAVSTRDEDIIVEVPGEDEKSFETIREIISQTARLEFKLLDDDDDFFAQLSRTAAPETLPQGLDFRQEIAPVGRDADGERMTQPTTYAYLSKQAGETSQQALQRLREWAATLTPPPDREIGFEVVKELVDEATLQEQEVGWRTYLLRSRADITGDMIRDAAAVPDQGTQSFGGWHVVLTFTDQGGRIFERITGANVNRRFAILLDGKVESAPEIRDRIAGQATITMGSRDPQAQLRDSRNLELVLRSGALPAPISPSNEQRIGPSLGRDSIRLGVEGAAAGAALVLLFMILYYRRGGVIADVAVVLNIVLQLAILASFGASMTLPGIAALALTLGMGVDANVLINERIREELRDGKSPRAAVEIGYSKALSAIVDGQLTTLISGVVLAQYGTGPIKGFAVTLMVGVVCSIFTGIVVTRVLFDLWVRSLGKKATFSLG